MKKGKGERGEYEVSDDGMEETTENMTIRIEPRGSDGAEIFVKFHSEEWREWFNAKAKREGMSPNEYLQKIFEDDMRKEAEREGISIEQLSTGAVEYAPMQPATYSPPRIPRSPDPFNSGETAPVPNNPFTHFFLSAVADGGPQARFKPGGWCDNQFDETPQYLKQHLAGNGSQWRAAFDPQSRNAAELWGIVERLNTLHMHVAMYFLAKMGDPRNGVKHPLMEAVTVSVDELLRVKCIQTRGHRRQLLQKDIAQCVKDLADMTTDVRNIKVEGKRAHIPNCKLFNIAEVYEEQLDMLGPSERVHVGWAIQAGMWASFWFTNEGGRYWVSAMARALLELDHGVNKRAHTLAFRIGALILTVAGGTDYLNQSLSITIGKLLRDIGELPDEDHREKDWARRTADALQAALDTLLGAGLLATYTFGPTYPDPGDRGRGWVERWLASTVTITTPAAVKKTKEVEAGTATLPPRLEKKRRNRGTGKPKRALEGKQYLDGADIAAIYAAYKARNWTQLTLAKHVKCARSTLSNILNKREAPSAELAARIRAFLDSPQET